MRKGNGASLGRNSMVAPVRHSSRQAAVFNEPKDEAVTVPIAAGSQSLL